MISATPVDPHRLAEIRDLFAEETRSVYGEFVNDLPNFLDQLHSHVRNRDRQAIKDCAHDLRGSSGNLGAVYVEECARRIEVLATNSDFTRTGATLLFLEIELARLAEWLYENNLMTEPA